MPAEFDFWLEIRLSWMKARLPLCKTREGSKHWEAQQSKALEIIMERNMVGWKSEKIISWSFRSLFRLEGHHDFFVSISLVFWVWNTLDGDCLLPVRLCQASQVVGGRGPFPHTKFHSAYITFTCVHNVFIIISSQFRGGPLFSRRRICRGRIYSVNAKLTCLPSRSKRINMLDYLERCKLLNFQLLQVLLLPLNLKGRRVAACLSAFFRL